MARATLTIEGLAAGGDAVAHHDGRVVFVDRAAPGDRVEVALIERPGDRALFGSVVEVLERGAARVEPACPVAAECGGCRWMHVDLAAQAQAKSKIFASALERIGGLELSSLQLMPLVTAPDALAYRRRARLHVRRGKVGYLRERTHALVEVAGCAVLEPALDRALRALPQALRDTQLLARVTEIDLVCEGAAWSLALHLPKLTGAIRTRAEALVQRVGARGAVLVAPGVAPSLVAQPVLGTLRPDVFAQVNAASNAALVAAAVAQLQPRAGQRVLELFAGSGNFTLPMAAAGAQVVAVEGAGPALSLLRRAADSRGLSARVKIVEGDALARARALAADGQRFDAVVLDPPRAGCSGLAPVAHAVGAERIVYVSCDPATLARDLAELRGGGFIPRWAQPFDLFPQTPHVEGLVRLERA